jgi:DNA repair exonuclease SbcCD ATPase subunit
MSNADREQVSPSGVPGNAGSPFALLEAERQRLEQFTREQLAQIARARDGFLAEKRAIEQTLETRRQQLEEQGQLLRTRLQELHEREKKAGDRSDDALPERNANYRRRRFSSLIDKRKLEEESVDPELHSLREQLSEMKQTMVLLRGERDAVWDELQQVRQELQRAQEEKVQAGSSPPANPAQAAELEALRRQVQQQQGLLQELQAKQRRNFLSDELQRRLDQLKSERDAALSEVERLVQAPEDWSKQEEEFAALSRELSQRESKLQEDLRLLAQEHARLEKTAADFQERNRQLDQERVELANRDREFRFREEKLRLREAEIKEMRDLIEQDNALARKELVQERQEVARLRELLQDRGG